MTWRIVRKDCAQLWPLLTIVTVAQLANAAMWLALGPFREPRGLVTVASLFSGATMLGMAALVVAVVQQDVLPGVSQDWLVRPIRRSDLLRAKLTFMVLLVQGPALLADLAHGLAAGFAFRDVLIAGLSRSTLMVLVFDLPVFAIAAMTSTLVQVAASMLAMWVVVVAGVFVGILARAGAVYRAAIRRSGGRDGVLEKRNSTHHFSCDGIHGWHSHLAGINQVILLARLRGLHRLEDVPNIERAVK